MAWNVPSVFAAAAVLTAAQLNQIRDSLKAIGDPWTAYTPTWANTTTNPVIGNGTLTGGYTSAGKQVQFWASIVVGSTTTFGTGTGYSLSLPVSEKAMRWDFYGTLRDASGAASYPISGERSAAGVVTLRCENTVAGAAHRAMTATIPVTLATGDEIFISGTYEAA